MCGLIASLGEIEVSEGDKGGGVFSKWKLVVYERDIDALYRLNILWESLSLCIGTDAATRWWRLHRKAQSK